MWVRQALQQAHLCLLDRGWEEPCTRVEPVDFDRKLVPGPLRSGPHQVELRATVYVFGERALVHHPLPLDRVPWATLPGG